MSILAGLLNKLWWQVVAVTVTSLENIFQRRGTLVINFFSFFTARKEHSSILLADVEFQVCIVYNFQVQGRRALGGSIVCGIILSLDALGVGSRWTPRTYRAWRCRRIFVHWHCWIFVPLGGNRNWQWRGRYVADVWPLCELRRWGPPLALQTLSERSKVLYFIVT